MPVHVLIVILVVGGVLLAIACRQYDKCAHQRKKLLEGRLAMSPDEWFATFCADAGIGPAGAGGAQRADR